jgi:hypothetical protein
MINFYGTRHARSSASATDIGMSNYPDRLEPLEQEWVIGLRATSKSPQWSDNRPPSVALHVEKSAVVGNLSTRYRP